MTPEARRDLAKKRLISVLGRHGAALARTLEQKISDAGPINQRIDPHILIPARNELVQAGVILKLREHGVDWFALAETPPQDVRDRIEVQFQTYRMILTGEFNSRLGEVLEIAVYRAMLRSTDLQYLGGFRGLSNEPTFTKQKKEEPPSIFAGHELRGNKRFDFLVGREGHWGAIEVKNVREWLYPDRVEIRDMLAKAADINMPPILIARRIPYVTRRLLAPAGVLIWETRHQYYPPEYGNIAGLVRDKDSLGYFDVIPSDHPDKNLTEFVTRIVPEELADANRRFQEYRDLLQSFGEGAIKYKEFAARIRRRENGSNEDKDEELSDVPF